MPRLNYFLYKYRVRTKIILVILILLFVPIELYLLFNLLYLAKIFPNVYVNNLHLGGHTRQEATNLVTSLQKNIPQELTLQYNDRKFVVDSKNIDWKIDINKTVQRAYDIGRLDTFVGNAFTRIDLLFTPHKINPQLNWQEIELKNTIASIAAQIDEPDIPPTINIENKNNLKIATVSAGRQGKQIDRELLSSQILQNLANAQTNIIDIPIINNPEIITEEKLEQTRIFAQNLINKTLTLVYKDNNWDLDDKSLINFLSVYDTFDDQKIASWSSLLANTINREPQNALFNWDQQKVTEFKPAKPGLTVNQQQTIESIKNGIQFLANSKDMKYQFDISVNETQPKITTDQVNDLGIKELIGIGESWFYHSIASRIHNLTLASSKLHGVLIPPGEEFSMLKTLGDIDAAHGYQPAYIIQNGRTVLGDGGGVCQTSTTMFRAALNAGLDIKTRFPHAYRVSYYENNFDVGVDASIFSPTADFTFVNDTPGHILVQVLVDSKSMYLRYELYGTYDGRKVDRSKSRIWDQTPPPPDLYQDDPTLAPGIIKQIDWAAWGAKTAFDWKVTKNGEILHEKTFYSNYRPWQAIYLRGPQP